MNFIDIIILVAFAWFGYKGFTKGLIVELASIVALILGVYGGLKFSYIISGMLVDDIDGKYLPIVSFTLTFVVIVVVVFVIGKLVEKIINIAALKFVNKIAGAGFGIIKVALIISVLITIIESYDRKLNFIPAEQKQSSLLYNPMLSVAEIILPELEQNKLLQSVKDDFGKDENNPAE